jgi:hypothetical protein
MAFFPPEDNTQDVSGIPINDAMAQLELQRRLKMAQQLQQSKAPEGQMISGHYVAPSWTQSLANAYSIYKGKKAEEEAISKYGEYTKSKETKMADALKKLGSAFEPTTTTSTAMQATEMPLTQGMNVPTSSFGTTDQVNQIAPNYINQAPVQNMTGTTTQMNPVTTTSTTQPTLGGIEKAFGQYATDVNNPKLLEAMLSNRYEKMLKGKEPIKLGAGDVLVGEDYKPLYTAPNKPTAPTVRTMRMGTNEVTQQYDDKTGKWTEIAKGPAFKPTEEISFDPQVLSAMADQALAGDKSVFTNLGRGAQGAKNIVALRTAMNNKMLENGWSGKDIAAKNAEFIGMTSGQRTLGTRTANIEMAGTEFSNMLPLAREASALVPRSGFLPFGKANVMFDEQTNDPALRQFAAANNSLVNVYARAISPSGQPTISDKDHAREMLSTAFDQKSYNATLDQLEREISAARKSPGQVRESMNRAITGRPEQATPTSQPSSVRSKADAILGIK